MIIIPLGELLVGLAPPHEHQGRAPVGVEIVTGGLLELALELVDVAQ